MVPLRSAISLCPGCLGALRKTLSLDSLCASPGFSFRVATLQRLVPPPSPLTGLPFPPSSTRIHSTSRWRYIHRHLAISPVFHSQSPVRTVDDEIMLPSEPRSCTRGRWLGRGVPDPCHRCEILEAHNEKNSTNFVFFFNNAQFLPHARDAVSEDGVLIFSLFGKSQRKKPIDGECMC